MRRRPVAHDGPAALGRTIAPERSASSRAAPARPSASRGTARREALGLARVRHRHERHAPRAALGLAVERVERPRRARAAPRASPARARAARVRVVARPGRQHRVRRAREQALPPRRRDASVVLELLGQVDQHGLWRGHGQRGEQDRVEATDGDEPAPARWAARAPGSPRPAWPRCRRGSTRPASPLCASAWSRGGAPARLAHVPRSLLTRSPPRCARPRVQRSSRAATRAAARRSSSSGRASSSARGAPSRAGAARACRRRRS